MPSILTAGGEVKDFEAQLMTCQQHFDEFIRLAGFEIHKPHVALDGYPNVRSNEVTKEEIIGHIKYVLGQGNGYVDFYVTFHFDAEGNLVEHGVWE